MTMLNELLSIKTFRESKAELEVHMQRAVLEKATQLRDQEQRALEAYRDWAHARERALFDDLCTRTVRLRDIQDVQLDVSEMRIQEQAHVRRHADSEAQRVSQSDKLDERRQVHSEAMRVRQKFLELVSAETDELARETERVADLEMDEVVQFGREQIDWTMDEEHA